jgi:rhodanese-related sulfurtransferase
VWPFSRRDKVSASFVDIEPHEALRRVKKGDVLIDVRQPSELGALRAAKAVNVPLGDLAGYVAGFDADKPIMLVCRSGSRSRRAAKVLAGQGFTDVSNVRGGLTAWGRAGLPLKGSKAPKR